MVMLREPLAQASSKVVEYNHEASDMTVVLPEARFYLCATAKALSAWRSVFHDRLLVLKSEELFADPQKIIDRISDFAGADRSPINAGKTAGRRRSAFRAPKKVCADFYADPDVQGCKRQLESVANMKFDYQTTCG